MPSTSTGRGSTLPLADRAGRPRAARSRACTRARAAGESTIDDHVLLRATTSRRSSSSSPSRPTRRRGRRTCGASGRGRPAIAFARHAAATRSAPRRARAAAAPGSACGGRRCRRGARATPRPARGGSRRRRSRRSRARARSRTARARASARAVEERGDLRARPRPAVWPPSVRVRIVMGGFIERLVAAEIGATYNFYRDGDGAAVRREPARALSRGRATARRPCSSARRRATAAPASPASRSPPSGS